MTKDTLAGLIVGWVIGVALACGAIELYTRWRIVQINSDLHYQQGPPLNGEPVPTKGDGK